MSDAISDPMPDGETPEYGETFWREGQRGGYPRRLPAHPHRVRLDDDVAAVFPDDASVNEALRTLIRLRVDRSSDGDQARSA